MGQTRTRLWAKFSAFGWHNAQWGTGVSGTEQREDALPQGARSLKGKEQVERAAVIEGHTAPLPVQVHPNPPGWRPSDAQQGGLRCCQCPQAASSAFHGPHGAGGAQSYTALSSHRLSCRAQGIATLPIVLILPGRASAGSIVYGLHLPAVAASRESLRTQHCWEMIEARWAVKGRRCSWWSQLDAAAVGRDEQAVVCCARVQG